MKADEMKMFHHNFIQIPEIDSPKFYNIRLPGRCMGFCCEWSSKINGIFLSASVGLWLIHNKIITMAMSIFTKSQEQQQISNYKYFTIENETEQKKLMMSVLCLQMNWITLLQLDRINPNPNEISFYCSERKSERDSLCTNVIYGSLSFFDAVLVLLVACMHV